MRPPAEVKLKEVRLCVLLSEVKGCHLCANTSTRCWCLHSPLHRPVAAYIAHMSACLCAI
jgi:hypothetical protein